jgi:hypothetical protein
LPKIILYLGIVKIISGKWGIRGLVGLAPRFIMIGLGDVMREIWLIWMILMVSERLLFARKTNPID